MSTPFIVAEMSCNHMQSLKLAHEIIDAARDAGADAVKLQTFKPETMVLDHDYIIPSGPWMGRRLIDLYREAQTPWEWHAELFDHIRKLGMIPFSTVFDREGVDFLETLNCQMYKISSFEITDLELIKYVASKDKNMVISTGMASFEEIHQALVAASNVLNVTLLKCTSTYPTPIDEANVLTIPHMLKSFNCEIGLSDHTIGCGAACAAVALGAVMIEKHVTMSHGFATLDEKFSADPCEFETFVHFVRQTYESLGIPGYGPDSSEEPSTDLRRSLYYARDVKGGAHLMPEDVTTARPGNGMHPHSYQDALGKLILQDVKAGTPILGEHLE